MQDKELYQHLLGLTAPWTVSEVKLDMRFQEIHVSVGITNGVAEGINSKIMSIKRRAGG